MRATIASMTSTMLRPVFAEILGASSAGMQIMSSISFRGTVGVGVYQIYFIDNGHNFKVVVKRKERICKASAPQPLRSVNYEYRPSQAARDPGDFVVEVNVSRSVDKIENICFAVLCLVFEFDGACFYRYSAFAFKVHIVEKLVFHFTGRYGLRHFEKIRSASVDLPWSICAIMQNFLYSRCPLTSFVPPFGKNALYYFILYNTIFLLNLSSISKLFFNLCPVGLDSPRRI